MNLHIWNKETFGDVNNFVTFKLQKLAYIQSKISMLHPSHCILHEEKQVIHNLNIALNL